MGNSRAAGIIEPNLSAALAVLGVRVVMVSFAVAGMSVYAQLSL